MKKLLFLFLFLGLECTLFAQAKAPSMKGYWYCAETAQMFVIQTDKDDTVQGRGASYSAGNGKFIEMQIMTQTPKLTESGENVYFMKLYDRKKPNTVYDLTCEYFLQQPIISVSTTGKRDKISYFYRLDNMTAKTPVN